MKYIQRIYHRFATVCASDKTTQKSICDHPLCVELEQLIGTPPHMIKGIPSVIFGSSLGIGNISYPSENQIVDRISRHHPGSYCDAFSAPLIVADREFKK